MRFLYIQHKTYPNISSRAVYIFLEENMKNISFLTLLCFFHLSSFTEPRIDLSEGSMMADGNFIFNYNLRDFLNLKEQDMGLKSSIGASYLLYDAWALGLGLSMDLTFAPYSNGMWGVKIFTDYFFITQSIYYPYMGISFTPGYSLNVSQARLKAGLGGGVLISLSESVALDLGLRPELSIKVYESQKWKFSLGAGLIGIRISF
jgi:hypothetical protein